MPVFGEERYVIQKWFVNANRFGSMQLGERIDIHVYPYKTLEVTPNQHWMCHAEQFQVV